MIAPAFASDVGVDNDPLQMPDGGYLWFDVNGITPSHDRTLDQVKDEVEARWRDDEIAKRLKAKADDLWEAQGRCHAGGARHRQRPQGRDDPGLQRGKPAPLRPAKLVEAAFSTSKGAAASADGDAGPRALCSA